MIELTIIGGIFLVIGSLVYGVLLPNKNKASSQPTKNTFAPQQLLPSNTIFPTSQPQTEDEWDIYYANRQAQDQLKEQAKQQEYVAMNNSLDAKSNQLKEAWIINFAMQKQNEITSQQLELKEGLMSMDYQQKHFDLSKREWIQEQKEYENHLKDMFLDLKGEVFAFRQEKFEQNLQSAIKEANLQIEQKQFSFEKYTFDVLQQLTTKENDTAKGEIQLMQNSMLQTHKEKELNLQAQHNQLNYMAQMNGVKQQFLQARNERIKWFETKWGNPDELREGIKLDEEAKAAENAHRWFLNARKELEKEYEEKNKSWFS